MILSVMVDAPNRSRAAREESESPSKVANMFGASQQMFIEVGPPPATLRVWQVEPPDESKLIDGQPRGTILVVHGYRNQAFWMLMHRKELAKAGYRLFFVDLRGHGKSTGDHITYGAVESRDLVQVIDEIDRRGLIVGQLGVWGHSMGAATSIQLAGRDSRVRAVVAVAPYTTMRDVVPHVVKRGVPFYGALVGSERMTELVDLAGERAGFDPDDADTLRAIQQTDAQILIMHGDWDMIVPYDHGRRLHEAASEHSRLVTLHATGHVMSDVDVGGKVDRESVAWFDEWLVAGAD